MYIEKNFGEEEKSLVLYIIFSIHIKLAFKDLYIYKVIKSQLSSSNRHRLFS